MNKIRLPKIRNVTIKDPLFGAYAALVAESIVPYQWEILNDRVPGAEKSYCIENFKIAAGEATGIRRRGYRHPPGRCVYGYRRVQVVGSSGLLY